MAKAPLKQLSVNTFEATRIISPKLSTKKNTPMITDGQLMKKKNAISKQLIPKEETTETTSESYWRKMAEHYRTKLEEVIHENEQLHEIVDELNKDNDNLRAIANHCEYLTDIIEKLTNDEKDKPSVCVRLF